MSDLILPVPSQLRQSMVLPVLRSLTFPVPLHLAQVVTIGIPAYYHGARSGNTLLARGKAGIAGRPGVRQEKPCARADS
jgi:hypothetical protein